MEHFTPQSALIGGVMIGLAATLYFLTVGRYAGISGIARGVAFGGPDRTMDALFILGLLLGGGVWFWFAQRGVIQPPASPLAAVVIGGIFVGFGTAVGRGCTSGHGVCGLGRLSIASLVAVLVFLGTGMATVFLARVITGGAF